MSVFNAFMQTFQCSCEKRCFLICTVVCLHTHGEVRHTGTVKCAIHYWLIWYKN